MTDSVVLFEELACANGKRIGLATLNSEKSLNSLSVEMVGLLDPQLRQWQTDDSIVAVLLQGAGEKAFCAGGDIRRLYDTMLACGSESKNEYAESFFATEYQLDYLIHTFQKPIICWGHGIVMGGGIGLMSGASHRVVTQASRLAMPEINIGLYPDVGGTWFLNRTPGKTGLFLGLTGANINAADALFIGLADRFILQEFKTELLVALQASPWMTDASANTAILNKTLREFEQRSKASLPESQVRSHFDLINELCDGDSCADVAEKIISLQTDDKWMQKAAATLKGGCPMTAHLVWEQLHRGKFLTLKEVFEMEFIISVQCTKHLDFPEGVRALLVDKDGKPKWQHANVRDVPADYVASHFSLPGANFKI
ncbi:MAG TPA: enoyl-CoA hydratase/isomerase family protein [Pseudomonadales bacterium]|nr:enoyl-CoA hydratase/isomerase family protein [Pseudomonadales bacterium]